jgi:hypothetical protein
MAQVLGVRKLLPELIYQYFPNRTFVADDKCPLQP